MWQFNFLCYLTLSKQDLYSYCVVVVVDGTLSFLYLYHFRALQELHITFKPESSAPFPPTPSISSVSHDGLKDTLSDMSMDTMGSDVASVSQSDISHHSLSYGEQQHLRTDVAENRYEKKTLFSISQYVHQHPRSLPYTCLSQKKLLCRVPQTLWLRPRAQRVTIMCPIMHRNTPTLIIGHTIVTL